MKHLKLTVQWVAAVAALISCVLWWYSATVKVKPVESRDSVGLLNMTLSDAGAGVDTLARFPKSTGRKRPDE